MIKYFTRRPGFVLAACMLGILAAPAAAAPFHMTGLGIEIDRRIEPVYYRRNNGFPAAALGIFALGTAAIVAGRRRRQDDCGYYSECGYGTDYYGGGGYGRGYYGGGRYGGRARFVGGGYGRRGGYRGGGSRGAGHAHTGSGRR